MEAGKTLLTPMQPLRLMINQFNIIYRANQFADATGIAVLTDMKFCIALMYALQPSIVEDGCNKLKKTYYHSPYWTAVSLPVAQSSLF